MENSLLIGLSRQVALARELDVIANNMANVSTNGFKSRSPVFEQYLMPTARAEEFPRADRMFRYVIDADTPLDLSQGATEQTGNPLDVAIQGDGFLVVDTPQGERFTRNGAMQLDNQGRLVNSDGFLVLGDGGPIAVDPEATDLTVSPDGVISSSAGEFGQLRLVRFDNPQGLRNAGANLFATDEAPLPALDTATIRSGMIERSNVNAVLEMTRLMDVSRAYTSTANMLQRMAELQRTAVQRLGEPV
ncbi:MAG: flagellar basal-body rod protein FlgF [Salinarimonas sp.]